MYSLNKNQGQNMGEQKNIKILIADDDASIRTTLEFILQDNGYLVDTASTGIEAISKSSSEFYNVAILDYKLPDMDGVVLGKNIKETNNDTEVIILTGRATLESALKAIKEDIYDYLTKPIDPDKLIEVIASAVAKQRLILENKRLLWELRKSNKELERINSFKDGLISMISHDLRSPISSLKGFNYSLLNGYAGELSEQQKEIINTENDAIETMMELINNLLDIRQIEAGQLQMKQEIADIKLNVIDPVIKRLQPQLREKSIKINIEAEDDIPKIDIDIARIAQVIQNLVQNAIKFSKVNTQIIICIKKALKGSIEILVKDEGKGIVREELKSIFEVFYTNDDTKRTRTKSGRGLGLAICKEIIKAHNGWIWAESDGSDKGSTFVVTLPIINSKTNEEINNNEKKDTGN